MNEKILTDIVSVRLELQQVEDALASKSKALYDLGEYVDYHHYEGKAEGIAYAILKIDHLLSTLGVSKNEE